MAVATKTFVENNLPSYRSTWTLSFTGVDVVHGSGAFTIPRPALTAKYVYAGKAYEYIEGTWYIYVDGKHYNHQTISYQRGSVNSFVSATSGVGYNIGVGANDDNTAQLYLSWYFDSNNPTVRSVPITVSQSYVYMASSNTPTNDGSLYNCFLVDGVTKLEGVIGYLTLDAPPTFTASALSGDTDGYWAGATTVSTTVSSASAKYGGNIVSSSLTIGSQTVSGSGNGTLSIALANAGTFTPQVSLTDSRGQVTTKSLDVITVNPYLVPSVSFDVYRTNASGVKDDEGHCGLIIGQMTYTDALANLAKPSVSIDGTPIEDVVGATVTWYTGYSASTGVDATTEIDGTNITWADVASGSTVYALIDCDYDITGKFSEGLSYQIGIIANDSIDGHSTPIIQTLSTAFYTIDFQAGGKEIAFGAPANDDVTNYEDGLFKCAMSFRLKDHLIWIGTRSEYDDAVDDGKMPEHSIVIITDEDADYIVEQGTSGIWTYRKWSSGIAECWGRADNKTVPSGWSSSGINLGLPFTFLTMRNWQIQHQNWQISNCYGYPTTISNTYDNINIQTYSSEAMSSAIFMVFCQGTWK